ncbi:MAG: BolA/IbaG family iron-sulfur metabolism protein [Chromatocurvus sp.]
MDAKTVESLVRAHFEDCDVRVEGAGSNYDITVIGDVFAGKRPVQRQQLVYAALNDRIAAGEIHAVNIRTLTPDQV